MILGHCHKCNKEISDTLGFGAYCSCPLIETNVDLRSCNCKRYAEEISRLRADLINAQQSGFWGRTCARQSDKLKNQKNKLDEAIILLKAWQTSKWSDFVKETPSELYLQTTEFLKENNR